MYLPIQITGFPFKIDLIKDLFSLLPNALYLVFDRRCKGEQVYYLFMINNNFREFLKL